MALSWSELSADHKIVFLLESLANEKDQQVPIACRSCDKIFFDNISLLEHFRSHFHQDGTFNESPLVGSFVPPGNGSNFNARSSQYTHYLSVPADARNYVAHEKIGPCAWQNVSPNMPNLSLANSPVPALTQNSVQLRGASLTDRPHSYLSPSMFCSAVSHGTFASQPNQASNLHSKFSSQPIGSLNFHSPIKPTGHDVFSSETTERSKLSFPIESGTSTSQSIKHSNFCSRITVDAFSSQSNPGTGTLALGTTSCLGQTARKNEVEDLFSGYTKPYIKQLERPIQETIVVHDDVGGNNNPDEMDLTLKL